MKYEEMIKTTDPLTAAVWPLTAQLIIVLGMFICFKGYLVLGVSISVGLLILLILVYWEIYNAHEEHLAAKKERRPYMPELEKFQKEAAACTDITEADELAMRWLHSLCKEHGKEGQHAKKLLDIVGELLDIHP